MSYSPYMEAPTRAYPPEYDEPETTKQEVLNVVLGRSDADGLGRAYHDLMNETPMGSWAEGLAFDDDAERELLAYLGEKWNELPPRVRRVFEKRAEESV